MWWDGGDRAITAREKALIEEHGPSSFSIPLVRAADPQPAELAEQQGEVIVHALADAYTAGAEGLQFGGLARMEALAAALAATGKQQVGEVQGEALATIIAALENSKPTHDRYPEPVERHADALAHARALAARQPGAWNSMDTAPKDGTEVLIEVELRAGVSGKCLVGHYMAGGHCIEDHPPIAEGWYFWNGCAFDKAAKPIRWTHIQPAQGIDLGTGVKAIAAERERQLQAEGFTRNGDQQYRRGELAKAATAYVQLAAMDLEAGTRDHIAWHGPAAVWPWAPEWWKPVDARRDLVRAGALIAAQIDLIDQRDAAPGVGNG